MFTLSYQPISLLLLILLLVPSSWGYDNIDNTISSIGDVPKDNELFFLNRDALLHNSNRVISPRVVGGTEAGGPIEYQVLLLLNYGEDGIGRCGGSLIAPNVVLRYVCYLNGRCFILILLIYQDYYLSFVEYFYQIVQRIVKWAM